MRLQIKKGTIYMTDLNQQDLVNIWILIACGSKFIEIFNEADFSQLTWDNIKSVMKQKFELFTLKYSSPPEIRAAIEKELTKIDEKRAIEELYKILEINQVDETNFMQFGDRTLAEMLEINTKNITTEDNNDHQ